MTVKDILSRIQYTVIIDGVEHTDRDITFSTWLETMMKQSEKASGYTPEKIFDPVARENFQKYFAVAYYAGLIPAKVTETRTAEIIDGCYVFAVETSGTLEPETDSTDSILKALYTLKEKGLQAGQSDRSKTASCGRSNGDICGYGAGYGARPYFEGGVGASCFWEILKKCGFSVSCHYSKHSNFYSAEREVV